MKNKNSSENKNMGGIMTTDLLEKVAVDTNGGNYWVKYFNTDDSIERVKLFEGQKLEAKVKCGLELLRAKLILGHAAWYPYLLRCGISQPTASRRKSLAVLFMIWHGILKSNETVTQNHVISGLELFFDKSFKMNDFRNHIFELNKDEIVESLQVAAGGLPRSTLTKFLGFDLKKVLKGLHVVEETQHEWADCDRSEVRKSLNVLVQIAQQVLTDLNEFNLIREGNVVSPEN